MKRNNASKVEIVKTAIYHLVLNPIIVKELRSRMRGWRAFAILTGYLLFLALFSYGIYRLILYTTAGAGGGLGMPLSPFVGQALYLAITNLSLMAVAFLTPALTAGAISSEHENLTLEMLQATPLTAHTIIWGKLIATAGYIFLLLFATIPIVSLALTFGGVAPLDLLQAGLVILATGVTFGMLGLFFSAWRKRTIQAIVLSYLVILLFIGGTLALYIFWGVTIQDFPPRYILVANPFSGLSSVFASATGYQTNGPSGLTVLLSGVDPDSNRMEGIQPLWHYNLAFNLVLSTGLYLLATRFIQPVRAWRMTWRAIAGLALLIALYLGLGGAIFRKDVIALISSPPPTSTPTPFPQPMMRAPVMQLPTPTSTLVQPPTPISTPVQPVSPLPTDTPGPTAGSE